MNGPEQILSFWLDEVGQTKWFAQNDALDATVKERFEETLQGATEGRFSLWLTYPTGALAYIILTDQLSRNMYRGTERAFSTDRLALAAAKSAISNGWDLKLDEPARHFFYLPLMHSENLCDQDRCVRLICERTSLMLPLRLRHARAHRAVIREFGRFPSRNEALGRATTTSERNFIARGGYGQILQEMQSVQAA